VKEFELTMRLRNNLIKSKRLALGLKASECARRIGITYGKYLDYEGLRESPLSHRPAGQFKPSARAVARFFGCQPEELWPDAVLAVRQPEVVTTIRSAEALALAKLTVPDELPATPEELLGDREEIAQLEEAMGRLAERERQLLRARFWNDQTIRGAGLLRVDGSGKVHPSHAQAIEKKALRKLRRAMHDIRMRDQLERDELQRAAPRSQWWRFSPTRLR
jgi:transcriptional regulator with XRE-family HTH domain